MEKAPCEHGVWRVLEYNEDIVVSINVVHLYGYSAKNDAWNLEENIPQNFVAICA